MSRRKARELAMKALYQWDVAGRDPRRALERLLADNALPEADVGFCRSLLSGAREHRRLLDAAISRDATAWSLERVGAVERNVIRVALFELFFLDDVPAAVSMDEAVELAKCFGGLPAGQFVNGVLDAAARKGAPGEQGGDDVPQTASRRQPSPAGSGDAEVRD